MKVIKISLTIIVVIAIVACIIHWKPRMEEPPPPIQAENPFISRIEQKIEQLKSKPENKFSNDFHNEVLSDINNFHKQNKFDTIQSKNDQWKENLRKSLFSAYAEKFIKQSKNVFRASLWKPDELRFIQTEKDELKKSKLLVGGSYVDKEFSSIQTVLNKYYEIVSFISSCKDYSYSGNRLSDHFPIADVKSKIERAANWRQNRLDNEYVNNCSRLHDELKKTPQLLFNKHVLFLENKIDEWSYLWCNFNNHKDYSQNLNKPLQNEINALGNSAIYDGINIDNEYDRLSRKWSVDNQNAYNATYPCD